MQTLEARAKQGKPQHRSPTADTAFNGELLTLKEAAQILKITRKTLYQWKAKGKIRTVKIAGSLVRIPRADLANLITA